MIAAGVALIAAGPARGQEPASGDDGPGAALWSVTPLDDQQLAGLVMWGAGGLGPVIAGAVLLVAWLDRLERFLRTPAPMR